ncbi:MAG: hypothetical protein II871_08810, partial [Clostridia bacterium]|nr:hypothetical protein [Clostridia bacterium]
PRAFIVQYPCFLSVFFAKLIIHESSKPGNPCGSPGLVLLGLNATAPFVLFLALIFVDLSMFFKTEGAVIVSAIPVCGCVFAYYYPLETLIAKAIVSKGAIVSKSKAIVSTVEKVISRMGF